MEKWMMEHRSWYEFVIFTYRIRFEELLEVVDVLRLGQWTALRVLFETQFGCMRL
jgi:hypothetical protein